MTANPTHKWTFAPRFPARAFGWNGSKLACQRLKEATVEIQKVAKSDPLLAAEGAILLLERLWPAFQQIDTSSGALGNAIYHTVATMIDLLITAPADPKTRTKWLDRLWEAFE